MVTNNNVQKLEESLQRMDKNMDVAIRTLSDIGLQDAHRSQSSDNIPSRS